MEGKCSRPLRADDYLKQFGAKIDNPAQGNEKAASLANAYNAFVLRWILSNYPTESRD